MMLKISPLNKSFRQPDKETVFKFDPLSATEMHFWLIRSMIRLLILKIETKIIIKQNCNDTKMSLKTSIMHTRSQNRFGAFSCQQSDNDVDAYTKEPQITFRTVCFGLITDERRLAHLILYTPLPPPPGLRAKL